MKKQKRRRGDFKQSFQCEYRQRSEIRSLDEGHEVGIKSLSPCNYLIPFQLYLNSIAVILCYLFLIIFHCLCYYSCFTFLPFSISNHPLPLSGNPHTIVHVYGSCTYFLQLPYSPCCTLHPHHYSVTTNLYSLIPLPFRPFP